MRDEHERPLTRSEVQYPQVSVVIPVYNGDRYLAEAIDSVLAQTYSAWDMIVVDDGSTDRTPTILQHYQQRYDRSIRVKRQANQGVAVARNQGIAMAQGDWIAFLDADDVFLPDKLAAQVALATTKPHLGMIHSGWQRVSQTGQLLRVVEPWQEIPQLTLETWLRWKPVLPSAMLFRRDWLQRSGGFDARFPPAEDTELVLRLALMGCEAEWLPQVTVKYRQHEHSAMHQGLPQARSLTAVVDQVFRQPNLPDSIRWQEPTIRYHTLVWIAWYLHYTGHLSAMTDYLQQAYHYSPYSVAGTMGHWATSFTTFSGNWGATFHAEDLARSSEWQSLMQWMQQNTS